jgi:hypothetical protein
MKSFLSITLFLAGVFSVATSLKAQNTTFTFFKDGKARMAYFGTMELPKQVTVNFVDTSGASAPWVYVFNKAATNKYILQPPANANQDQLTAKQIKEINKHLADRMQLALDHVLDSPRLNAFYKWWWGPDGLKAETEQLKALIITLRNNTIVTDPNVCRAPANGLVSGICRLETTLASPFDPYQISVLFNPDSSRLEAYVARNDWFRQALLQYWKAEFIWVSPPSLVTADREYQRSWESLDKLAAQALAYNDSLRKLNTLSCEDDADVQGLNGLIRALQADVVRELGKNPVVRMMDNKKNWYKLVWWFNFGNISPNPLGVTATDRLYTVRMFDASAAAIHDRLVDVRLDPGKQCCIVSMNGVDSLIRQRHSGAKVFADTLNDPIWAINSLRALRSGYKLLNKFEAPVTLCSAHPQYFLQFDAGANYYREPHNKNYRYMTTADSISFVVHNIPANLSISVNQVAKSASNNPQWVDEVSQLPGGLNTAASAVNLGEFAPVQTAAYQWPIRQTQVVSYFRGGRRPVPPPVPPNGFLLEVTFNAVTEQLPVTIDMTEEQLFRHFLSVFQLDVDPRTLSFFLSQCISPLPIRQIWNDPDVKNYLQRRLLDLFTQLDAFQRKNQTRFQLINNTAALLNGNDFTKLFSYTAITDRSLPPSADSLATVTDSSSGRRSQIFAVPVYDSARTVMATILAKRTPKNDTAALHPIYPGLRLGSMKRFAISAGIAVTTTLYYEKSVSTTNGQLAVTNNSNQVGYLVGIHIYPCKYFTIDNSFLGFRNGHFWNRFSFYAGLGLPNPLNEYYGGISLDLVPGFKLIVGEHYYLYTRYQIVNNQIAKQANGVQTAGPFLSISLDPNAFVTLLGLFK